VPDDFRTWFGEQILDHDLTVTALSDMLDTYDGTIEDWLAGRAVPDPSQCGRLRTAGRAVRDAASVRPAAGRASL
jgi:hypothetical protein